MDKRILRTKNNLVQAFLLLGQQKHYSRITVTELAVKAGINRKTFYMYYTGIEDYLNRLEEELIESCEVIIDSLDFTKEADVISFFQKVREMVRDNYPLYQMLRKQDRIPALKEKAKAMILRSLQAQLDLKDRSNSPKTALYAEYIASGITGMLSLWISYPEMSVEEFTDTAALITLGGLRAIKQEYDTDCPS